MRRLAHDGVVHLQIVADRRDDDFSRVEAHPDRDLHPVRPPNLVCIPGDGLLHPEARITGAYGMVLDGEGRAKERHDPVAYNPVHGAFVAVHGLYHAIEHRVEEKPLRGLGVTIRKQLHRALDIGKQHGDLLALALEGCPRNQDLFGQVLRRVAPGRGKSAVAHNQLQGMATLGAELGGERRLASTVGTGSRERSGALLAEPRLRRVLVLALWAFHRRPRGRRRARGTTTLALRVIGNKEDVPFPRGCVRGSASPVRLAIADSPSLRKRLTSMQTGQMAAASGLPLATPQTRSEYVLLGTGTIHATTDPAPWNAPALKLGSVERRRTNKLVATPALL